MILKTRKFQTELSEKNSNIVKDMIQKQVFLPYSVDDDCIIVDIDTYLILAYFLKF